MKKHLAIISLLLAVFSLVGCRSKSRLTSDIAGSWSSVPEIVRNDDTISVRMIKVFNFQPATDDSGILFISAMISFEAPVPASPQMHIITPLSVNGAAMASIQGTFKTLSGDKILLSLDPATYDFHLDPDAVDYNYDMITAQATPYVGDLHAALASRFEQQIAPLIRDNILSVKQLTSIKIKDTLMQADLNGLTITLRRQL